jgi:hypothetical protein
MAKIQVNGMKKKKVMRAMSIQRIGIWITTETREEEIVIFVVNN